ncbi:hypothetical protein KUV65_00830 [Maritalea mobilis]|nr:hypothetical protein [Maritalea mobilis]MBY6199893.1 hypothetical protein [Maritalea mobilis]
MDARTDLTGHGVTNQPPARGDVGPVAGSRPGIDPAPLISRLGDGD